MTNLDFRRRHALLGAMLIALGCGGSGSGGSPPSGPIVELPPPLVGSGSETPTPAAAATPSDGVLPDAAQDADGPAWLRVFVSQDNRAELDPCGCPGSPSGGMGKRATLVPLLRATIPDALVVEGPTSLSRAVLGIEQVGGDERRRARVVLDALGVSRPDAFFPGQADFEALGPKELVPRATALNIPLVVSNLASPVPGIRDRLVVQRGDRRVVLLGLIGAARSAAQAAALPLTDAPSAVARILDDEAARGPIDLVVVFTDAEKRELAGWREAALAADVWFVPPGLRRDGRFQREEDRLLVHADPLGRAFRRLDVAFSGPPGRGLMATEEFPLIEVAKAEREHVAQSLELARAEAAGETERAATARRGLAEAKFRRGVHLRAAAEPSAGHRAAVTDQLIHPDLAVDGRVASILAGYNEDRIGALTASVAAAPQAPRGREFMGLDACTQCHPSQVAQWGRSPHAGAWKTLRDAGQTRNPDCLGCHTTGFGEAGGFVDPAEGTGLFNVQCEACHGPMDFHVSQANRMGVKADPGVPVIEATCTACHDARNSPEFDFETYSAAVAHTPPSETP